MQQLTIVNGEHSPGLPARSLREKNDANAGNMPGTDNTRSLSFCYRRFCVPALLRSCAPALLRSCAPALLRSCAPALLRSCAPALLRSCASRSCFNSPPSPIKIHRVSSPLVSELVLFPSFVYSTCHTKPSRFLVTSLLPVKPRPHQVLLEAFFHTNLCFLLFHWWCRGNTIY